MFWTFAAGALIIAALITFGPLLRGKSLWQALALALVFALPAASLWVYTQVGRPDAIKLETGRQAQQADPHASDGQEMDQMVNRLKARLADNPEDVEGWLLLSRSLRSMQRYDEALTAVETAYNAAPEVPAVMVELAEAQIYTTPNSIIGEKSIALLRRALDIDPAQQKALWLMGIAAAQAEDYQSAVNYWEILMPQLEPGSEIAQTLQSQLDEAKELMGVPVEEATPEPAEAAGWAGIPLRLTAAADLPPGVLYIMIRPAGMAMGAPLGVRRINNPVYPLELTINDCDSMMKERLISSENTLQIQARLSLTGSPAAKPGDWQSQVVEVVSGDASPVELSISRLVE